MPDSAIEGRRVRAMSLVAGCLLWEVTARLAATPFLPSASETLVALLGLMFSGQILGSLGTSLTNLTAGFLGAAVTGVGVGVVMARVPRAGAFVEPYLYALLAAPGILFVPLLFTLFGASRATLVGSVFLQAVFVVTASTAGALRPQNAPLIAMARAFGATESQLFWKVRLPAARPLVLNGLRLGVMLAVKGMVNGEVFIAVTGLGALIRTYGARFAPEQVLAVTIVITLISLTGTTALDGLASSKRRSAA